MFELVERYITIAGESPISGDIIYLFRFKGCNLNCSYCDTPYKQEINYIITEDEIVEDILKYKKKYKNLKILFTGGEPFLDDRQNKLINVIKRIRDIQFFIETNGSIEIINFKLPNCHYVFDWKSPSSGFGKSFFFDNLKKARRQNDCIKFVINKEDFSWLKGIVKKIDKINPGLPLYVSPQYNSLLLEDLAEFIIKEKLAISLSIQIHKVIWENKERGI